MGLALGGLDSPPSALHISRSLSSDVVPARVQTLSDVSAATPPSSPKRRAVRERRSDQDAMHNAFPTSNVRGETCADSSNWGVAKRGGGGGYSGAGNDEGPMPPSFEDFKGPQWQAEMLYRIEQAAKERGGGVVASGKK